MCSSGLPKHTKCFKAAELDQPHSSQYMHHPVHTNDSASASGRAPYVEQLPREVTLINAEKLQYHREESLKVLTLIPPFLFTLDRFGYVWLLTGFRKDFTV